MNAVRHKSGAPRENNRYGTSRVNKTRSRNPPEGRRNGNVNIPNLTWPNLTVIVVRHPSERARGRQAREAEGFLENGGFPSDTKDQKRGNLLFAFATVVRFEKNQRTQGQTNPG